MATPVPLPRKDEQIMASDYTALFHKTVKMNVVEK
jgi:hypothetical protein